VIGTRIGDVIDADDLEPARGLRIGSILACPVGDGRKSDGLAKLATSYCPGFEVLHQVGNESFHAAGPPFKRSRSTCALGWYSDQNPGRRRNIATRPIAR